MPFEMAKSYVLVDENVYEEKFKTSDKAQLSTNPFRNPYVKEAIKTRESMYRINEDETLTAEQANQLTKELIDKYRLNFIKATGKRRSYTSATTSPAKVAKSTTHQSGDNNHPDTSDIDQRSTSPTNVKPKSKSARQSRIPRSDWLSSKQSRKRSLSGESFETREDVQRAIGGYVTERDAEKIKPLLNALATAGYTSGRRLLDVNDYERMIIPKSKLADYIRQSTLVDPDRRSVRPENVETFQRFLNDKGIDYTIAPNAIRKTRRKK
jgi:hypothetical protein